MEERIDLSRAYLIACVIRGKIEWNWKKLSIAGRETSSQVKRGLVEKKVAWCKKPTSFCKPCGAA